MESDKAVKFDLQPAEGIRWLRNLDEVIIINGDLSKRWVLQEIEADVWEWLWQEFSQQSIIKMIALMNSSTKIQSLQLLNELSTKWEKQGLIRRTN